MRIIIALMAILALPEIAGIVTRIPRFYDINL